MRNYDVLFDRTDRTVHFTKSDCQKNYGEVLLNLNLDEGKKDLDEKNNISMSSNQTIEPEIKNESLNNITNNKEILPRDNETNNKSQNLNESPHENNAENGTFLINGSKQFLEECSKLVKNNSMDSKELIEEKKDKNEENDSNN